MIEKKIDRRAIKTKKAICNAFSQLLAEKPIHKITVQEIADKADINRVTFYKHYLDVYDLYDKIEEENLIELGLIILQLEELGSEKLFSSLIDYIFDNKNIFRMMFSPNGTNRLRDSFSKLIEGLFRKVVSEQQNRNLNDDRITYYSCYRSQGCIAVIEKWVLNDFSEPKEVIIEIVSELDENTKKLIASLPQ